MTRKTVGYVHMEWTCPQCGTRNPGTATICSSCGAAQPEDVQFQQAAATEMITDEQLIAKAEAGADVHCPFCGARNPADAEQCQRCFADLSEATARDSGQTVGAYKKQTAAPIICPYCGTENEGTAVRCQNCNSNLPRPDAEPESAPRPQAKPQRRRGIQPLLWGLLAVVLIACAAIFYLSTRTEEIVGNVADVSWTRTIVVEGLVPVSYDDWEDQIPAGAVIGRCRQEVRRTSPQPQPNSVEVCGTPYTIDTGTGIGEVVQDCEYQVYDDYCAYEVDEWRVVDEQVVSGKDFAPSWPALQLSANQREGEREEEYAVIFNTDGRSYTYRTDDFNEFLSFEIGDRYILEVNALNNVRAVTSDN